MSATKTTTPITLAAAARIQSQAAKTGTNQGFASRAQSAAAKIVPGAKGATSASPSKGRSR